MTELRVTALVCSRKREDRKLYLNRRTREREILKGGRRRFVKRSSESLYH